MIWAFPICCYLCRRVFQCVVLLPESKDFGRQSLSGPGLVGTRPLSAGEGKQGRGGQAGGYVPLGRAGAASRLTALGTGKARVVVGWGCLHLCSSSDEEHENLSDCQALF